VPQFLQGLSSRRYAGRVRAGIASGIANGVSGTPTFFINNELHNTGWNFDLLHKAVRQAALEENL
jgi:protein-disulfide isomerase